MSFKTRTNQPLQPEVMDYNEQTNTLEIGTNVEIDGTLKVNSNDVKPYIIYDNENHWLTLTFPKGIVPINATYIIDGKKTSGQNVYTTIRITFAFNTEYNYWYFNVVSENNEVLVYTGEQGVWDGKKEFYFTIPNNIIIKSGEFVVDNTGYIYGHALFSA